MTNPIYVPMVLDVMMVNDAMKQDPIRSWDFSYQALEDKYFSCPEADPFSGGNGPLTTGTYLHWTLPRSLRISKNNSTDNFPLIPNRWLIVRIHRQQGGENVQRTWILESDVPNPHPANFIFTYTAVGDEVVTNWKNSIDAVRKAAASRCVKAGNANIINIGCAYDAASWKERDPKNLFLTAVTPGNLAFSGYIRFNSNVFSFYDDLSDVPDQATLSYQVIGWYSDPTQDILPVTAQNGTGTGNNTDALQSLDWSVAQEQDPTNADGSLYVGIAMGLNWNKTDTRPPYPDELAQAQEAQNMTVAIGNAGVDAFSTLVATQLKADGDETLAQKSLELLRAFQYDLLPLYNQQNGEALVYEKVRQQWFQSQQGGTRWSLQLKADEGDIQNGNMRIANMGNGNAGNENTSGGNMHENGKKTKVKPSEKDLAWLEQLNQDQDTFDKAVEQLTSLQWDLNGIWWKRGYMKAEASSLINATGITEGDLEPFLDPANASGALGKVLDQLKLVNQLLNQIPQPDPDPTLNPQDAWLKGVESFAGKKDLSAGWELVAVSKPRYWMPNNPNLLFSDIAPDALADPDASLEVRLMSQAITAFAVSGRSVSPGMLSGIIPGLPAIDLPAGTKQLYEEFFLLDPSNASQIAGKTGFDPGAVQDTMTNHNTTDYNMGVLPDFSLALWTQKWRPLYIEWQIRNVPIPYENQPSGANTPTVNWYFDGTDYRLKSGLSIKPEPLPKFISGRSLLSGHTHYSLGERLAQFVNLYGKGSPDLTDIYNEITDKDNWRFLSQDLSSFNSLYTQQDDRPFRRPTIETFNWEDQDIPFAKVIGYPDMPSMDGLNTPDFAQGLVNSIPSVKYASTDDHPFHAIRAGQAYLDKLIIYDKFGRTFTFIDDQGMALHNGATYPLVRDAALVPEQNSNYLPTILAPFQLPPRLLQPARLNMFLTDYCKDDQILGLNNGVNPICGWVIVNHLTHSILLFLPDGSSVGELRIAETADQQRLIAWNVTPQSPANTVDGLISLSRQLGLWTQYLVGKPEALFTNLLQIIDESLWTTDSQGVRTDQILARLIGRPLALVRMKLQFELCGNPVQSTEWPAPVRPGLEDPTVPDFTQSVFYIRLGDEASPQDGILGYYNGEDYTQLNTVVPMPGELPYMKQIGPLGIQDGNYIGLPFQQDACAMVTLLMDPRVAIHATTGILPLKQIMIPAEFIDEPLATIEISFRMGPLLSRVQPTTADTGVTPTHADSIHYLPIVEKQGAWSWWQRSVQNPGQANEVSVWQGFDLVDASTKATLPTDAASLHEGYLQFKANLSKSTQS